MVVLTCTVVVLTCFVMCGCFGNVCTCIYCVLYCLYCVFVFFPLCICILICFVCTSVRTDINYTVSGKYNKLYYCNEIFYVQTLLFPVGNVNIYKVVSKIFRTGAAIYTAVVVARSTDGW